MNNNNGNGHREPIAIIGIGCRLPGDANNPVQFWENLKKGVNGIVDVPSDRWDKDALFTPDFNISGKISVKKGGFIKDFDKFDIGFFGISPVEALRMDPQHRLLLETSYQAIEDAGVKLENLDGSRTAVYVGLSVTDYADIQNTPTERTNIGQHTNLGGAHSIAANRISYVFNLIGPSMAIDTACSSSLNAIHMACRSIWVGEADMALAGGVNSLLKPEPQMGFSRGGFLAPDGYSKAFDHRANGYVRSEGGGMILLKPYNQALKDGDDVYAVILGSAVNQDGRTNSITIPNPDSQSKMLEDAYKDAGVDPAKVQYIEAHGTGTAVGDPLESQSIGSVIGKARKNGKLLIGSVKSNIGHLEPASGFAGIAKLLLSIKNKKIPKNLHFEKWNPAIDFEGLKLEVPTELMDWPVNGNRTLYAGINSFGFGGANAHVVLRSADEVKYPEPSEDDGSPRLFVLSARSQNALKLLAETYIDFIKNTDESLTDICYSAGARRSGLEHKLSVSVRSKEDLISNLNAFINDEARIGMTYNRSARDLKHKIAFVFSGQGPQWYAMGRKLFNEEPLYREIITKIDKLLGEFVDWSLIEELDKNQDMSRTGQTGFDQPAIMALQIGLFELWKQNGITPDGIVGHSIGEVAAGYASGALTLEQAVQVIYYRSRGQELASDKGKMLAAGITLSQAKQEIKGMESKVSIAAINGPAMLTLSGDTEQIEELAERFDKKDIFHRILRVRVPFHSHHMEELKSQLIEDLKDLTPLKAKIPLYSTVTGKKENGRHLTTNYWYRNVREPVYFSNAVKEMISDGFDTFIEISPHPVLATGINDLLSDMNKKGLVLSSIRRKEDEKLQFYGSLGALFCRGINIEWEKVFNGRKKPVKLPYYTWEKESYWLEKEETRQMRLGMRKHPHLVSKIQSPHEKDNIIWDIELDKRITPYIEDHRVQGPVVFPGAGHVELGIACGIYSFGEDLGFLENINFMTALFLPDEGEPPEIKIDISSHNGDYFIYTRPRYTNGQWTLCSNGRMNHIGDEFVSRSYKIEDIRERCKTKVDKEAMHAELYESGLQLGPTFRSIDELWVGKDEAVSRVIVPESIEHDFDKYFLHPSILDSCFQTLFGLWFQGKPENEHMGVYIPVHIDRVKFFRKPTQIMWAHTKYISGDEQYRYGTVTIYNENGELVTEFQGFKAQYLKGSKDEHKNSVDNTFYKYKWEMKRLDENLRFREPKKYLTSLSSINTSIDNTIEKITKSSLYNEFNEMFIPKLNKLVSEYILSAYKELSIDLKKGEVLDSRELYNEKEIDPRHERLFNHTFKILSRTGYIKHEGNGKYLVNKTSFNPQVLEKKIITEHPDFKLEMTLFSRCAPELADILLGKKDPVELIFPEDRWDTVVTYYQQSYSFSRYNKISETGLKNLIKKLPSDQTLRVLEIGAGTGGVTNTLLPLFPADRTEYLFTDISNMFLQKAREQYGNMGFVKYQFLDIEKDPEEQGIRPNSFDIVIASDVIHATEDLKKTLSNVKKVLASGGVFILIEVTQPPNYLDLVFGMTEGWWRFTDMELRPEHACMNNKKWQNLLKDTGFKNTIAATDITDKRIVGQTVFFSEGPEFKIDIKDDISARKTNPGTWLVFSDNLGLAPKLSTKLKGMCKDVIFCETGGGFNETKTGFKIDASSREHMDALINRIKEKEQSLEGIIYLWGLTDQGNKFNSKILNDEQLKTAIPLINLIRSLNMIESKNLPGLFLITMRSQYVEGDTEQINLMQSPLWGLGRTIVNEKPNLKTTLIDISGIKPDEINGIVSELYAREREIEVGFRGKKRFIQKLMRMHPAMIKEESRITVPAFGSPYHTVIREAGVLDNLYLQSKERKELTDNEVEIMVKASALNFRDIMVAMGLLTDEAIEGGLFGRNFGLETAGIVSRTGKKVTEFKKGDEVVACSYDTFAGFSKTDKLLVIKKPHNLTFEEACTIPLVYLTAYYSLNYLCNISKDDWVLIHAATGGVGIAAVNLANLAGANIIATVSTKEKRNFLKKMGVKHIFNSRTLKFTDQVKKLTNGRGVDIVLNSLSGKAISQSIKCLAPFGRFVEIGKSDIYRNSKLGLKPFGNNLSYHVVDIDRMCRQKPELVNKLGNEVFDFFKNNKFKPHPFTAFPMSKVSDAFMYLAQAKHIGKVIVTTDNDTVNVEPENEYSFKKDGTYIVTGGSSGFGLATARWMAQKGAGNLILLSRSGPKYEEDREMIAEIKKSGSRAIVVKADITLKEDVDKLFSVELKKYPPLKGIIHAATTFGDTPLETMDSEIFMHVLRPKITGAWLLHEKTKKMNIDFFVSYSSISSVYGNPAQANYVAANYFLDQFSKYRRGLGLPANTINWGVIGETGFVSRTEKVEKLLTNQGWGVFSIKDAMTVLERVLLENPVNRVAADADWTSLGEFFPHQDDSRFIELISEKGKGKSLEGGAFKQQLLETDPSTRSAFLQEKIKEAVARVIGTSPDKLDINDPITKMGLDSLMANQLRNWIQGNLEIEYSMMRVMRGPTIVELAEQLLDELASEFESGEESENVKEMNKWIIREKKVKTPRYRLFCFPYLAGGASVFSSWPENISNDIEVCAVQFPGREERYEEKVFTDMEELVSKLAEVMLPLLDRPFAVYAHSFGGYIAYELLRYLRKNNGIVPAHFFVGGCTAPHINGFKKLYKVKPEDYEKWTENEIIDTIRALDIPGSILDDKEIMKKMLPGIKADIVTGLKYTSSSDEPLANNIIVLCGENDNVFTKSDNEAWSAYTSGNFDIVTVKKGSHIFVRDKKDEIIKLINKILH